jgi:hypothetical protein
MSGLEESKSELEESKSEDEEEFLPNKEIADLSDDDIKKKKKKKKPTKTTVCKEQKECARAQQQGNFDKVAASEDKENGMVSVNGNGSKKGKEKKKDTMKQTLLLDHLQWAGTQCSKMKTTNNSNMMKDANSDMVMMEPSSIKTTTMMNNDRAKDANGDTVMESGEATETVTPKKDDITGNDRTPMHGNRNKLNPIPTGTGYTLCLQSTPHHNGMGGHPSYACMPASSQKHWLQRIQITHEVYKSMQELETAQMSEFTHSWLLTT